MRKDDSKKLAYEMAQHKLNLFAYREMTQQFLEEESSVLDRELLLKISRLLQAVPLETLAAAHSGGSGQEMAAGQDAASMFQLQDGMQDMQLEGGLPAVLEHRQGIESEIYQNEMLAQYRAAEAAIEKVFEHAAQTAESEIPFLSAAAGNAQIEITKNMLLEKAEEYKEQFYQAMQGYLQDGNAGLDSNLLLRPEAGHAEQEGSDLKTFSSPQDGFDTELSQESPDSKTFSSPQAGFDTEPASDGTVLHQGYAVQEEAASDIEVFSDAELKLLLSHAQTASAASDGLQVQTASAASDGLHAGPAFGLASAQEREALETAQRRLNLIALREITGQLLEEDSGILHRQSLQEISRLLGNVSFAAQQPLQARDMQKAVPASGDGGAAQMPGISGLATAEAHSTALFRMIESAGVPQRKLIYLMIEKTADELLMERQDVQDGEFQQLVRVKKQLGEMDVNPYSGTDDTRFWESEETGRRLLQLLQPEGGSGKHMLGRSVHRQLSAFYRQMENDSGRDLARAEWQRLFQPQEWQQLQAQEWKVLFQPQKRRQLQVQARHHNTGRTDIQVQPQHGDKGRNSSRDRSRDSGTNLQNRHKARQSQMQFLLQHLEAGTESAHGSQPFSGQPGVLAAAQLLQKHKSSLPQTGAGQMLHIRSHKEFLQPPQKAFTSNLSKEQTVGAAMAGEKAGGAETAPKAAGSLDGETASKAAGSLDASVRKTAGSREAEWTKANDSQHASETENSWNINELETVYAGQNAFMQKKAGSRNISVPGAESSLDIAKLEAADNSRHAPVPETAGSWNKAAPDAQMVHTKLSGRPGAAAKAGRDLSKRKAEDAQQKQDIQKLAGNLLDAEHNLKNQTNKLHRMEQKLGEQEKDLQRLQNSHKQTAAQLKPSVQRRKLIEQVKAALHLERLRSGAE